MKKIVYILLPVIVIGLVGCSTEKPFVEAEQEDVIESESEQYMDEELPDSQTQEPDKETSQTEEVVDETSSEQTEITDTEAIREQIEMAVLDEEKVINDNNSSAEEEQKEIVQEEPQNTVVSYNPQNVVYLATEKVKSHGKITLIENLDRLLAEGSISQEEYNEYYPYDGAGYYSVFMETNLNKAKTTSGRLLGSEDEIAQYIADMLAVETGPYFLIEYAGVYTTGGTDFYEFRCYRA